MKFLHTADLHLDSAFCSYGAKDAQKQREEGRQLLRRIFECAEREKCDMILIAGDLFDGKFVSPESAELFCSLVEQSSAIVVLSPGNHDPYTENCFYAKVAERLADKLLLFTSPELQIFDIDRLGVSVYGYAFTSAVMTERPLSLIEELPEDDRNIKLFCGHADLGVPFSRYASVMLCELEKFGFAYSALGHVHNANDFEDDEGRVRYSGFAQGRAFDELGEGGVWIVELDGDTCSCERRVLSEKAFYISEIELSAGDTKSDIERKISEHAKKEGYGKASYVRLTLSGIAEESELYELLSNCDAIRDIIGVAHLEFINMTMPLLDVEYLERDATLRGELYRVLRPKLTSSDRSEREVALQALKIGLAAIDEKNIFGVIN